MKAYPMFSCMRLKPGPEVAVMAFAPAQLAPMTAPREASSSSIWMAMPPTWGNLSARFSAISLEGVIGYPAKNLHPAVIAASAHAWFPCQKWIWVVFLFDKEFISPSCARWFLCNFLTQLIVQYYNNAIQKQQCCYFLPSSKGVGMNSSFNNLVGSNLHSG